MACKTGLRSCHLAISAQSTSFNCWRVGAVHTTRGYGKQAKNQSTKFASKAVFPTPCPERMETLRCCAMAVAASFCHLSGLKRVTSLKNKQGSLRYSGSRLAKTSRCLSAIVLALHFCIRRLDCRHPVVYQLILTAVAHSAQVGKLLYHLRLLALYIGQQPL